MSWNVFYAVAIGLLTVAGAGLAGHLAATKRWHKWFFWGIGSVTVVLIYAQTRSNEEAQRHLQSQLNKIQQNTETPPQVNLNPNIMPAPVNILPAVPSPKTARVLLNETKVLPFIEGQQAAINVYWNNTGEATANQLVGGGKVYLVSLSDLAKGQKIAEKTIVGDFEKKEVPIIKASSHVPLNAGGTERVFFSQMGPVLSSQDVSDLASGQKMLYSLSAIYYSDETRNHYIHRCGFLQPPATPTSNWHYCILFSDQR